MSNQENYCNTNFSSLMRLGLSEVAEKLHHR